MRKFIVLAAAVATLVAGSAHAQTAQYSFSGTGVSGAINFTYAANPKAGPSTGSSPNVNDPIGSYVITGISGTFTDTNAGIIDRAITGIVAANPGNPEPTNLLAPASFGHYIVTNGVPGPGGVAPGLAYDNLYYPGGSPQVATDYPFHDGVFDIYGIVFTLADGNAVNFWSNGDFGGGASYGVAVTDGKDILDYTGDVSLAAVPEPATWAMLIVGFGAMGGAVRRDRKAAASVRFA
jgi:hypothetical protein